MDNRRLKKTEKRSRKRKRDHDIKLAQEIGESVFRNGNYKDSITVKRTGKTFKLDPDRLKEIKKSLYWYQKRTRSKCAARQDNHCADCDAYTTGTLEHKRPMSVGGKTTRQNCEMLCSKCNSKRDQHFRNKKKIENSQIENPRLGKVVLIKIMPETIELGTATWIEIGQVELPMNQQLFDQLQGLCPEERGRIRIFGREMDVPRYQKSFMQPYHFSGMNHPAEPLHDLFRPYLDFANAWLDNLEIRSQRWKFNACLINWYPTGRDYIGTHSDDEKQLWPGSPVFSMTIYNPSQLGRHKRIFRLRGKKSGSVNPADIVLKHMQYVVMGGACQREYKHEVPKTAKSVPQRINITFRCFRDA